MSLLPEVGDGWQRLDPRMLLVHPIKELLKFLPALIGLFVAGTSGGLDVRYQLLGVAVPVGLGVLRYLTTAYRILPDRIELRRGLLNRHQLATRRERVRTVDLTASPIHRVLGLSSARIGTGTASSQDEDQLELDGLPTERARALRHELLASTPESSASDSALAMPGTDDPHDDEAILELDPRWARYGPLTSTGVVLTGAAIAVGSQVLTELGQEVPTFRVDDPTDFLWILPLMLLGLLVVVTVVAVAGYLVTNWGFTLSRSTRDGSFHLRRGLLTTRETTIDDERVGGVVVGEPFGLRLAGAARLSAIVTGLDRGEQGSSTLVPPAPREAVAHAAGSVLGTPAPVTGELRTHGPAAVRRRWTRALVPAAVVSSLLVLLVVAGARPWVLVLAAVPPAVAAALAADRARALGHDLTGGFLVARSGSLLRRREVLANDAVIGWTFRATWFQRRAGLTTLVATTAGGPQRVEVLDVTEPDAVAVAAEAVPGLVTQFVTGPATNH